MVLRDSYNSQIQIISPFGQKPKGTDHIRDIVVRADSNKCRRAKSSMKNGRSLLVQVGEFHVDDLAASNKTLVG